jgi:hypothetical protein
MTNNVAYNPQNFSIQTKVLEQQSCDSAISKAKELVHEKKSCMVQRASRKICNEAFDVFKKNIQDAFPHDDYKDLISLTLISREKLFFIDLKDRVINILSNRDQV